MDAVVRDATMLGVAAIVPLVIRARRRAGARVEGRRRASSAGSASPSRRPSSAAARSCPTIAAVASFEAVLAAAGDDRDRDVRRARARRRAVELDARPVASRPASALVLVGPEGGWSEGEVALAASRGAQLIALGPRTLRAELAPVVALSALWTRWGW